MSTLSGVTQKGEKGKKFQSLDINSLYNHANKGESSEPHLQRNTAVRRHGMQTLGKVTTPRRPPANLPSLKAEHSGSDPSVSLVPSGGTGWGTKPGETGPSPNSQPTSQPPSTTTPASSTPQPLGPNAPAAAGIGMPAAPPSIAPPTPAPQPPVVKTIIGSTTSSGDKTWSSVTCGDAGPSFLAHQSPQFQQEFPSLSGEGAAQGHPGSGGGGMKGGSGPDVQYGPGPPLRPQTEGSWIAGGGTARSAGSGAGGAVPPGAALLNPAISQHPPPYHPPHHPQELGSSSRANLGPFGPGVGPVGLGSSNMGGGPNSLSGGGPAPSQTSAANMTVPSQFRNVIPNFLRKASGFSTIMPPTSSAPSSNSSTNSSTFQNNSRPSRFSNQSESNRNAPSSRHADPSEDLAPRPIIREEDLSRMDEISRDGGWAAQNDIDYNQKIAFSDDESTGVEDDKESSKEKTTAHKEPEIREIAEKREISDDEKQPAERQISNSGPVSHGNSGDRLANVQEQERDQMWAARGPGAGGPPIDFRQHPRQAHPMIESEDPWSRKRRQNSEKLLQVAERAKQRKEEEEKKFEESRTRSIGSDSSSGGNTILKKSKDDEPYDIRMSGWDKEDNLGSGGLPKNDGSYFRQQIPSLMDGRDREGPRDFRDRDYNRSGFNTPPRFQKQMQVAPPQGREPQGGYEGNRWGQNRDPVRRHMPTMGNTQHGHGGYMKNMQGQLLRGRPPLSDMADISDNMTDRLASKDVDDKGSRPINDDRDRRDRPEQEWEGRRGNSNSSWDSRHYDDKSQRKENRKPNNEPVYKSQSSSFSEDRDMDRPQKIETRDRPERPQRPDSRASRDSRNSRDENKSVPENNEFSWNLDLDKDTKDDKLRRRDLTMKDEKRDIRREGHVPGPITKEKMSAYENKLMKTEKREVISSSLINSVSEEDNRNSKLGGQLAQPSLISSSDGWLDGQDMTGSAASSLSKDNLLHSLPRMPSSDDMADKSSLLKDEMGYDKKKDGGQLRDKDGKNARSRGDRGPRSGANDRQGGGNRQGGQGFNSNSSNYFFSRNNGGPAPYSRENDRRRPHGKGGFKDKLAMSDSDGSLDEMSVSTESGKEDKKTDRRHPPRASKSGERKKDKDERNHRETKKSDNDENFTSRKHSGGGSGSQGYDSVNRKEGFAPRGQPSRRGRGGGYRAAGRGSLGNVAGHYGPPGSKSPFPQSNSLGHHDNRSAEEDDKMNDRFDDGHHHSDMDKSKTKSQSQGNMTGGNRQPKESRKGDLNAKGKTGRPKGGSAGDDRDSTSEGGSDSDSKKQTRNMRKTDKNKSNQRAAGEKRVPYNASHVNGRPTHSDDDNSFQEVKGKKVGKESRPLSRGRKDSKGKSGPPTGGQPGNAVGTSAGQGGGNQNKNNATSKPFHEKWTNKPPRLQKLDNVRKQQQMGQQSDVSEMNKINQNSAPMFSSAIRDVNCTMAPAPLPAKSAWDKPITAALKSQSPTNALHLSSSIGNSAEKTGIEIPDHVQSGTNSQTSSPSAEKVMSTKLTREVVDKGLLDGATPPVQTIIFENKNYKYTMKPNQRIDKGKLDVDLDGATHGIAGLSFKTGVDLKTCDNKTQESLQMQMTFKNEDNADMKLDFFESDLSQLTEEKNIPRSIHLGQADLDEKIALVKKVWETASSPMEQHQVVQHQLDDSGHVVPSSSSSSSFPPSFGGGVESALDHTAGHQVDDNTFNNADGYGPTMQGAGSYSTGAGGMMKQDPNNPAGGVKPQPQQAAVMSSTIGAHSGQSLSSPPPVLNQPGHFGFQTQYSTMPTIPSPPAVIMNPQGGQVPTNTQDYVPQHGFPFSSHTMIGSQTARSSFSAQPFNAYSLLNQSQTSFNQFIQTPPTGSAPPDMYSSVGPYRLPPSYGQTPSNQSTVLISSTSNSLMSASVKTTPQQPPSVGPIGTKGGYVNSQIQMPYLSYEAPHNLIATNYLQPSQLVQQRHGAGSVTAGMQPSSSFFSGSTGAPGGFSSMLGTNSQSIHSATAFSMQGFNNQTAATPGSAPPSSNVGHPQYSPMGHFRTASPYMKQGVPGQHQPEASKSPSNSQDALSNSVFSNSGGGGQIPSPKSRSSAGSNNGSGKQMSVSPQQPSPTQSHHKFPSYQQNLSQPPPNSQAGQQRSASQLSSVQQRSNNGTSGGASPLNNPQHLKYPTGPGPIQRPPPPYPQCGQYVTQQQPQRRVQQQQHGPPPRMQQAHVKNYPFIQQGNQVKLESSMEGKSGQDKFMDGGSSSAKTEKKEEVSASADP